MTPNLKVTTVVATLLHSALLVGPWVHATKAPPGHAKDSGAPIEVQTNFASGTKSDPAAGPNRDPMASASESQFLLVAVDLAPSSPGPTSVEPKADVSEQSPKLDPLPEQQPAPANPAEAARSVLERGASAQAATAMQATEPEIDRGAPAQALAASSERPPVSAKALDRVASPQKAAHSRAGGGGGNGGSRTRRARPPKREETIKTVAEPVQIDMGQPGGADALLFGEGSPGLSHDLSSPPRIGGYVYWECPWPAAADQAGINHAVVHVTVDVAAGGKPTRAHLIDQPGYEFGEDALRCAMEQHYIAGRDANGTPVDGTTRKFSVQFNRRKPKPSVSP